MRARGAPSLARDGLVLAVSGLPRATFVLYVQGTALAAGGAGSPLHDGLQCVGGELVRIGVKSANGKSQYPDPGELSLSVRGGVRGTGGLRTYQAIYRNVSGPCGTRANTSNGVAVIWSL
ncbi:MAG: hypothetical protein ACKVWV_04935, partial [Planctomycetota bacterium]